MRKYLFVAVAAMTAVAFAAVAYAQEPEAPEMSVKVTPKKAGKKKKPKNSQINLSIVNHETTRTLSELRIRAPKTFKLSTKGLTRCDEQVLEAQGPKACPKASRVGKGIAHALVGVNSPTPTPLTFDVTPVVTGNNRILFHLAGRELGVVVPAPGRINGRNLDIEVPLEAQQPVPGTWAGLVDLQTTMTARKRKKYLASTNGCKRRKHAFSARLTFVDNGVSPAGTETAKATSKCKK